MLALPPSLQVLQHATRGAGASPALRLFRVSEDKTGQDSTGWGFKGQDLGEAST